MTRQDPIAQIVADWLDVSPHSMDAYRSAYARVEAQIISAEKRARGQCACIARRLNEPRVAGAIEGAQE